MTHPLPHCPNCNGSNTYFDGHFQVCLTCSHEWDRNEQTATFHQNIKDSNGNILTEGCDIILIKDLKLKGSSTILKKGAKAKTIHLVEGDHEIDCKIDGIKVMLKACFVKKA